MRSIVALTLLLTAAPAWAQSPAKPLPADARLKAKRDMLEREYQILLSRLMPNYNGISIDRHFAEYTPRGETLIGIHPGFSKYSFDFGRLGPGVQTWVDSRRAALKAARIESVGVGGKYGAADVSLPVDLERANAWYDCQMKAYALSHRNPFSLRELEAISLPDHDPPLQIPGF